MIEAASIRPIEAKDTNTLYELARANMPYSWSRRVFADCLGDDYYGWLLTQGNHDLANEVAGFAVVLAQLGECQLLNICVKDSKRRQGLATLLLNQVMTFARDQGLRRIILEVRASNAAAIQFYEQNGFQLVGKRRHYYRAPVGREDALLYHLLTRPPLKPITAEPV